jgi:hypothetical protein
MRKDRQTDRQTQTQTDRETDGRTDRRTDQQTDMMKPIVASRNFANAPKKTQNLMHLPNVTHVQHHVLWNAIASQCKLLSAL